MMRIKSSKFIKSSTKLEELPPDTLPEYAFIGRSNVGKSSLINYLTGRTALAQTSSTPGKTRLVNHFLINNQWYLVDLPGYGYAKVSQSERQEFSKMIDTYLLNRRSLMTVFILMDSRHVPLEKDIQFCYDLGSKEMPLAIVLTKIDKISQSELHQRKNQLIKALNEYWEELPKIFATSSSKKVGGDEILAYIDEVNKLFT